MKGELALSTIFILLLLFFIDPFGILMPPPYLTMLVALLLVVFALFAVVVWREKVKDERENLHRLVSARFAYLAGAGGIVTAIILQSFNHSLDPYLVYILIFMIGAKIVGQIYGKTKF